MRRLVGAQDSWGEQLPALRLHACMYQYVYRAFFLITIVLSDS
jgi:hypothetical protein